MASFGLVCIFICATVTLCNADCGQLYANKVTNADKKAIVSKHNYLRGLISQGLVPNQPKGINLKNIQWDDRLAAEAQKIANTCDFGHVAVRDDRFRVGQNLGWTGASDLVPGEDWNGVTQMWFDEYKNFVYPKTSNGVTGHYTQVVWANTYLIGCGFTCYRKPNGTWYEKLYVCNYGPAGNYVGAAPYKL